MRRWTSVVTFGWLLGVASTAMANGRPPSTNGIYVRPGDAQTLYVRTTFGLLITHDNCSFRWVCEQNIGYGGVFDPKYAIAADGTIFATTYTGLRVSRDGGCSFTTATSELPMTAPDRIADVWIDAIDIGPSGHVWVATADSGRPNNVYRSTDNGVTFAPRGVPSPTIWWKSVRVAPSDAQRVYITGYQVAGTSPDGGLLPPTTHLLRSDNAGESWTSSPLTGVAFGQTPLVYVVAVHPTMANTIFVVSEGANEPNGDRLYRSTDGGQTLQEVLAVTGRLRDVVIRETGEVIVAAAGAFRSSDGGATFEPIANWIDPQAKPPQLGCVAQRGSELVGCGANWNPDFKAIAQATDAAQWQKLFRFVELAGPLECPAGTGGHDVCAPLWPGLQAQFGATGPSCPALAPDQPPTKPPPATGGCCDVGDRSARGSLVLALVIGAVLRRRRRRSARPYGDGTASSAATPSRQLG